MTQLMTVCPQIFENSKCWSQPIYVVVVVNEDDNEDDKGGRYGLGEDRDNVHDHHGDCQGDASVDAGRGAGGGATVRALFCRLIGADSEHCHQPGATRPPNASATLLALGTSGPLSLKAQTLTWMLMRTLSRRCNVPPL